MNLKPRSEWQELFVAFSRLGVRVRADSAIAPHLTLGIGGRVRLLAFFPEEGPLAECRRLCHERHVPFIIIGGGSNIAFADGSVEAVAAVNQIGGIVPVPTYGGIVPVPTYGGIVPVPPSGGIVPVPPDGGIVPASMGGGIAAECSGRLAIGAGVKTSTLMSWCRKNGIAGLEFLAGIPGTVGGAAAVNAGAFGGSMADVLGGARIIDATGRTLEVGREHFRFTYRGSNLKLGDEIIAGVTIGCRLDTPQAVGSRIAGYQRRRRESHPSYNLRSAGCFFKNPIINGRKESAGKILEECGFRGKGMGELYLSEQHANFLINRGNATFSDLVAAEAEVAALVERMRGIRLEREVVFVSPSGEKY